MSPSGCVRRFIVVLGTAVAVWASGSLVPALQAQQAPAPAASAPVLTTDEEREAFLEKARVIRTRSAGKGVTNTLRATLSDGTITHDASIQTIDEAKTVFETNRGTELNFKDSWRFNVAAYRIDRLLGLGMIPTTVERRHRGKAGSYTWWVDDVLMDEGERYHNNHRAPDTADWNQQMWLTRMFDQLIANVDRNLGNQLIDKAWRVWMIDHSRAFRMNKEPRHMAQLSGIERGVLERLRRLDKRTLQQATDGYLLSGEIDALLARRDHIVDFFDKAGEKAVFDKTMRCCR